MKSAWKLGEIAGIAIFLHSTFLILVAWVVFSQLRAGQGLLALGTELGFVLALFGVIVLHELGHALTARRFGVRTRDITLLPIGGIARMERMPVTPLQELLVALAGPGVNLALAALLFAVLLPVYGFEGLSLAHADFLVRLMWVNLALALFNLLPAFPMDGGRALRAGLALRLDYIRATQLAAGLGQSMAIGFGLLGLIFNPMLLLIAFFIWIGAAAEAAGTRLQAFTRGIPLSEIMITQFETLTPDASLEQASAHVLKGFQHDFPIIEDGRPVGILTQADLFRALLEQGPEARIGSVMQTDFESLAAGDLLEQILPRLDSGTCETLPVMRQGQLVGLVNLRQIGEWMMLQAVKHPVRN